MGEAADETFSPPPPVAAPRTALRVLDDAMQAHGGGGMSEDFGLARAYAGMRSLRIADGPDEVHLRAISRLEIGRHGARMRAWREGVAPEPVA